MVWHEVSWFSSDNDLFRPSTAPTPFPSALDSDYHLSRFVHDHLTLSPAIIPDAQALRRVDEVLFYRIVDSVVSDHGQ